MWPRPWLRPEVCLAPAIRRVSAALSRIQTGSAAHDLAALGRDRNARVSKSLLRRKAPGQIGFSGMRHATNFLTWRRV
jgi:hypothetical protein